MKNGMLVIISVAAFITGCATFTGCSSNIETDETRVYSNPVVPLNADPCIYRHTDGYYYYTGTKTVAQYSVTVNSVTTVILAEDASFKTVTLRRSNTINGLRTCGEKTIISEDFIESMWGTSWRIWAPQIHYINGVWYMFFTLRSDKNGWSGQLYAVKCSDEDPMTGTWDFVGQIAPGTIGTLGIDGTVFEQNDQWYIIWSQYVYDGGTYDEDGVTGSSGSYSITINGTVYSSLANTNRWTCIFIGKLNSADVTTITDAAIISVPQYDWECSGTTAAKANVNEGAAILQRNGKVFLVYRASAGDETSCLGMLTAASDADLCNMSSWVKSTEPVFMTCEANSVYGPGHCSFTTDGDNDVIVYHARSYAGLYLNYNLSTTTTECTKDPYRSVRAKVFTWNTDGTPNFGQPE